MAGETIHPISGYDDQNAPHLTIAHHHKADDGSEWLREGDGYKEIVQAHAVERHIKPTVESVALGDVAAWTEYVKRFAKATDAGRILLTWNDKGLRSVLDYHTDLATPGRAQWTATHPFEKTDAWTRWEALANGDTRWTQEEAVKRLDRASEDIVDPDAATVLGIIRTLRSTVRMSADSELREDGSSLVSFTKNSTITSTTPSKVPIPSEIEIAIPALKGHTHEQDGKVVPVLYRLTVKVRPSVDDATHTLGFRFFMPTAERVLEDAYADRVARARELLGEGYTLLRAAS